jgi:hypothetical protein
MKRLSDKDAIKNMVLFLFGIVLFALNVPRIGNVSVEAKQTTSITYTIKSSSTPYQDKYKAYRTYNEKTKQYYTLRSYLEQLERVGGGTLILKAGTYEICNTLYVPSHVTIYLEDGTIIKKTEQTGTDEMKSAKSLFQLVAPSKSKTAGIYGAYDGEKDIKFIGTGTATIDMNYVDGAIGIIFVHNSKASILGITFQNMYSGHFIELDASRDITIENNNFEGHKASKSGMKEAINIDTPDKNTGGIHVTWTNYDRTPNKDILIRNNYFQDLERAIGTHKYSEGKYHENVQIINNVIEDTTSDAIRILNWASPTITGNEIKRVNEGNGTNRAILASGVKHPVITNNRFTDTARPIHIMPWKNSPGADGKGGSEYAVTYSEIDNVDIALMLKNDLTRMGENFIRINRIYNVFSSNTDKYYYTEEFIHR